MAVSCSEPAQPVDYLPEDTRTRVDEIFAEWDGPGSPGAVLAVSRDGRTIYSRGYGLANLEYGIPIAPNTVFHVASVSKQFTAHCILLLAQEGRLSLDDPVRRHLPYVPDFGVEITIRHLLHHTSGLRDQWELLRWAGWRMDDVITQEHLLGMVRRQRALNFPPGSEHLYSNTGYTLLAEVVAAVSGMPFGDYTRERVFVPVGMGDTFFYVDHERLVPDRAYSYRAAGPGRFAKKILSFANAGATSLFTTARDLVRWIAYLDSIKGTPIAEEMERRYTLTSGETIAYAAGLSVDEYRGLRRVGHSGSDAGYRAYCGRFPDHGLGIAVLANLASMVPAELAMRVAEVFLGEDMGPQPASPEGGPALSADELRPYAGIYAVSGFGQLVEIAQEGGQLRASFAEGPASALLPLEPDVFWVAAARQRLAFTRSDGTVTGFSISRPGGSEAGRRCLESLPPAEAGSFCGDFYSPELDTVYRIRLRDDGLWVEHQRLPDTSLLPIGRDGFQGRRPGTGTFSFVRAQDGTVAGFGLTGGRCRDLRFRRLGASL